MKDYLISLTRSAASPAHARNIMREYLQARILAALQQAGAMIPLAFHGGTALRFLYAIARYSEDLDFALEQPGNHYDFRAYLRTIQTEFHAEGYHIQLRVNDQKIVHSAFVRFIGLLNELGLSPHRDEVFSVKLEVDTRPPAGAVTTTTVIRRHVPLHLQHHDRASLLAGKLHAILQRPYTKGRDIYDLFWYLSDPNWPPPNLVLLRNALIQTGWSGEPVNESNWRGFVSARLRSVNWERLRTDVAPFLERQAELPLLSPENLKHLLQAA
jgi:predicted nucleotidyltransferase component of viral defense system